jgi:hypothetical protein
MGRGLSHDEAWHFCGQDVTLTFRLRAASARHAILSLRERKKKKKKSEGEELIVDSGKADPALLQRLRS